MKKKNAIGAAVMAAAILVSFPLGTNKSFARLREDLRGEYYLDSTGYSIWEGLDARREEARNLITLAERYEEADPELRQYVDRLEYAVDVSESFWLEDMKDTGTEAEYNRRLGEAAEELAARLKAGKLSERDAKYPDRILANLRSEQDKIERSSFNDRVREYNARLEQFPANLLKHISGVSAIAPFEQ